MDPIGELGKIVTIRYCLNSIRLGKKKQGMEEKHYILSSRVVGQWLQMENGEFSFAASINLDSLPLLPTPSWERLLNCSSLDMAFRAVCGFQPQCF